MSISIRIGGRVASAYLHNNLTFIEGRKGSEYQVVISNPFNVRVKAVLSVDGLNVITGEPCDYNDQGYVINPYGSITIDGWRISDAAVRAFKFGNDSESYGALSGQGVDNNGVIGVALFKERVNVRAVAKTYYTPQWQPFYAAPVYDSFGPIGLVETGSAAMNCSASIAPTSALRSLSHPVGECHDASIGTGQGQQIQSDSREIRFQHEGFAASIETIYYDTWEGLLRRGVVQQKISVPPLPNAFPANTKYAKSF